MERTAQVVRTVRTGAVGLDLALGGGVRLVRRTHSRTTESATLLIRGGPGTGKSVLAQHLALNLAGDLEGDVLYACIEVLPSEVLAQRMGFDDFDDRYVVDLSRVGETVPSTERPRLLLGMQDIPGDGTSPDVGRMLLDLTRIALERGFSPKVVVVDSLSDGYALGNTVPRPTVDGVCKLAIEQGWALILIEEAPTEAPSPWTFAVDTVLSLRIAGGANGDQASRELLVTKHRFGACEPGPHRTQIGRDRLRVIPPLTAYRLAQESLRLPEASRGRSLEIPLVGAPQDTGEIFDVADGEGFALVLETAGPHPVSATVLAQLSDVIGRAGSAASGIGVMFAEGGVVGRHSNGLSLWLSTLHQFADGSDWLEGVLTALSTWEHPVAAIRIGPTGRLQVYERASDLRRATTLFTNLMKESGFLVVLFGNDATDAVLAANVDAVWTAEMTTEGPAGAKVSVHADRSGKSRKVFPDMKKIKELRSSKEA